MTREEWLAARRQWIEARRNDLKVPDGYKTLNYAGLDKEEDEWVTPPQMTSDSHDGLVLVAKDFLSFEKARDKSKRIRRYGGYLPELGFNKVLDCALCRAGLSRENIYLTQVVHLLPCGTASKNHRKEVAGDSFEKVTAHEIRGRVVVALGDLAIRYCCSSTAAAKRVFKTIHPSARRGTEEERAQKIADKLKMAEQYRLNESGG